VRQHIPSLSALQAFEAAGRHLSFTRAALELNLTQSAISRHIRGLEARLGVRLFRRAKQRVALSEAGEAYLPEIRSCLDRIETSTKQVLIYRRGAGVLNLATLPTFGTKWLAPRLESFLSKHPGILLNFVVQTEPFDFSGSDIDAAIHFGTSLWPNVVAERLIGEELIPVCSPSLRGKIGSIAAPADLMKFPLLQLTPLPSAWNEWLRAAGVTRQLSHQGPRFEHFSMAIQATISNLGILLVPHFLVADDIREGRLVVPHPVTIKTNMAYYFIYPQSKSSLPSIRAFRDWILETAAVSEAECRNLSSETVHSSTR
jgi:LysR family transcriptional regulator, glycine cleavage system transcriptional activator